MSRPSLRQVAAALLGLGIVAGLIAYVGPAKLVVTAKEASLVFFGAAFLAYALFFVLRGVRWSLLLDPVTAVGPGTTASLSATGWLVSSFIPFKAGDVGRTALLARREDAGLAEVGGTVAIERALDMVGIAVAASAGLAWIAFTGTGDLPPAAAKAVGVAWILPILALGGLWLIGRLLPDAENLLADLARSFRRGLTGLLEHPSTLAPIAVLTVLVTIAQAAIFVALFLAFSPGAPLVPVMAAAPLFLLSFAISVTPGNVGTYEAAFVAVFALFGFAAEMLAPMAVLVHVSTTLIVIVLGSLGFAWHLATRPETETPSAAEVDA